MAGLNKEIQKFFEDAFANRLSRNEIDEKIKQFSNNYEIISLKRLNQSFEFYAVTQFQSEEFKRMDVSNAMDPNYFGKTFGTKSDYDAGSNYLRAKLPLLITQHSVVFNSTKNNTTLNFNSNQFNENCFLLFKYLVKNYEKKGKIKYINIYYFLKQISKDKKETYRFKMLIENDYKPYIGEHYLIKITKFERAEYAYEDTELPILRDLEKKFFKTI
jgi:hypothetical protein